MSSGHVADRLDSLQLTLLGHQRCAAAFEVRTFILLGCSPP
jgi:hypothetical protein